ncbi:hypothetical protein [Bacillus sp. FSL K6-3431]|uniref:hypothetical protein n=1 Tax=Bacillus sp. FSL K6-3431 TaxID=2921500 RepID=UPI0030F905D9
MHNRYLICLLMCAVMLYFFVPELQPEFAGTKGMFSIVWLIFALLVIAGNLSALLFAPKRQRKKKLPTNTGMKKENRIRAR